MDLITARNNAVKKLYHFKDLLDGDEIEPKDFKVVMDAFFAFDEAVKDQLTEPREVIPQYFDFTQNYSERVEQFEKVEQMDLVLRPQDSWMELENGDFLNIDKIDFVSKENKTVLFSCGKWSGQDTLSIKDLHRIRFALQTKRFK